MSIPYLTASRIVQTIAHIDELPPDETRIAATRFKNLAAAGYFPRVDDPNATATSARLYQRLELARAAVLIDALAAGMEGSVLKSIAAALDKPPGVNVRPASDVDTGASREGSGLVAAVRGVLANDPGRWLLCFSTGRENGRIVHISCVIHLPEGESTERRVILLRHPIIVGTIDLTARFKPFGWLLRDVAGG